MRTSRHPDSISQTRIVQSPRKSVLPEDYLSSLPPTVHRLAASVKHARTRFAPYNLSHRPSSLEIRFMEKSLGRRPNNDVTLQDAKVGRSAFIRGLEGLPENAFQCALEMKEAEREAARLRALTTAWELQAINRRKDFVLAVEAADVRKLIQSDDELRLFKTVLEHRSVDELKDEEASHVAAYGQDLTQFALEDERLDQIEEAYSTDEGDDSDNDDSAGDDSEDDGSAGDDSEDDDSEDDDSEDDGSAGDDSEDDDSEDGDSEDDDSEDDGSEDALITTLANIINVGSAGLESGSEGSSEGESE